MFRFVSANIRINNGERRQKIAKYLQMSLVCASWHKPYHAVAFVARKVCHRVWQGGREWQQVSMVADTGIKQIVLAKLNGGGSGKIKIF
jgi:hypothetical protein